MGCVQCWSNGRVERGGTGGQGGGSGGVDRCLIQRRGGGFVDTVALHMDFRTRFQNQLSNYAIS